MMKNKLTLHFFCAVLLLLSYTAKAQLVPTPDHVVVVVLENHGYSTIIGSADAPYINSLYADTFGALFTQSHGVTHPSQPNYMYLFSGDNQNVILDFTPISLLLPFSTPNLGASLLQNGRTFVGYSEDLPSVGYTGDQSGDYHRKHNPWVNWQDGTTNGIPAALNQPLTAFPTNFNNLPTLSFVIPNQQNDMHDGTVAQCDAWMQNHLGAYVQWAHSHNSLLIVTFDEDEGLIGSNQIPTIFNGQMVKHGQYSETIDHNNVLRTLEDMYGLPYAGQSATAVPITDCWVFKPVSQFTGTPRTFCPGQTVQFTDSSLHEPTAIQWQFSGGNVSGSTARTPSVFFDSAGSYTVTLISSNQMGSDTLAIPGYITVYPIPQVSLSANSLSLCAGDTATITAGGAVSFNWVSAPGLLSNSAGTIKARPLTTADYLVVGTSNGCVSDTATLHITVDSLLPVTLSITPWQDTTVCEGTVLSFSANVVNGGPNPVYDWRINGTHTGSNSNTFSTFATGAGYTINCNLSSSFTCAVPHTLSAGAINISVSQAPAASITATDSLLTCTAADSYQWFLNGQPIPGAVAQTLVADTNGIYQAKAFNAVGCNTISNAITINRIETGIAETKIGTIQIVPNPNKGQFNIKWNGAPQTTAIIEIQDLTGRKVTTREVFIKNTKEIISFNLPGLEKGTYLVSMYSQKARATAKIIIE